jgi:hypothetical protein
MRVVGNFANGSLRNLLTSNGIKWRLAAGRRLSKVDSVARVANPRAQLLVCRTKWVDAERTFPMPDMHSANYMISRIIIRIARVE